jgi:hypothetical protein
MQTFLPYPDIIKTAKCLDYRRLGKQRVEAWQIYCAITDPDYGWQNHPSVNMWRENKDFLLKYGIAICKEWIGRGYNDAMLNRFENVVKISNIAESKKPQWFGLSDFHASHRSNLLRKDFEYYKQFGWIESDDLQYVWP